MVECIICHRQQADIQILGNVHVTVCGDVHCKDKNGNTVGEWLLDDSDNGHYFCIDGLKSFEIVVSNKKYTIMNDKRIIKGLHNRIQEYKKEQKKSDKVIYPDKKVA